MNRRAIATLIRRDLKIVLQSKGVTIPLIIVPVIMLIVLPGLAALAPLAEDASGGAMSDLTTMLAQMPASLQAQFAGYSLAESIVILAVVYLMAPMYLIVPLMVASVIAADSFAGEKERKTLEALLYTPITDRDLFVAKLLSAWLPAVAVAWGGFVLYSVVANIAGWPTMGRVFFPNWMWVALAFWVAPAVAGLGLAATVIVSARVKSFQEAYQLGAIVVLPVVALLIAQGAGVMYFSLGLVMALGLVVWLIDAALIWYGSRSFRRTDLLSQL
ncbi:MAG: ABC transporter permease subunit [Caldilineaceae bacterium]